MKPKPTPKAVLILLLIGILLWANAPADSDRRAAASRLTLLPQSEAASLVGRGLALDATGQACGMSTDDQTCRTCDEETTATFFTAQSNRQSHTNDQAVSVAWQVFHVTAAGWTNLCDADRANTGADQDGCDYTGAAGQFGVLTGGAMWLRASGGTAHYNVVQGERYAQKIYVCADPAPQTCTDTDYTILTSLTEQYKRPGEVTVTLTEGAPRKWPDFCRPDGLLDERVCGTTKTVQTSTIDCTATFGTTWTCTDNACAETGLVPGTHGGPITTEYNSATNKVIIKSGGITSGTMDPKPTITISELDTIGPPNTWLTPASPVCVVAAGDAQCGAGRCLPAAKPPPCEGVTDCVIDTLTGKEAKTDSQKIFVALKERSAAGNIGQLLGVSAGVGTVVVGGLMHVSTASSLILIPGIGWLAATAAVVGGWIGKNIGDRISDAALLKFGVCMDKASGVIGAFANFLNVSPGTATLILLGGGFVLLLLLFMPRRT